MARTRILIAEDDDALAAALSAALESREEFRVVGLARHVADVLPQVARHRPDVLLLDLSFPDGESIGLIPQVSMMSPSTKTMVLSCHDMPVVLKAARDAGAVDYLVKGEDLNIMFDRITRVASQAAIVP